MYVKFPELFQNRAMWAKEELTI